ncbi:RsmD family RNA methyltransferase [Bdellovibrio svalbardensis]|uniref:RsmD family RNA methyltransferase n=1 Tax=Bdellovibrio svalbardensis TaxID=2972972 RepID=A0ABT6DK17_9BACT|nr:RsmD family RNA methyltransferase [Bdellovibrio svalbardensis]MDG0816879.1 RsmD family RNA methyltransferase [Bdellovibrio svalbardensis]
MSSINPYFTFNYSQPEEYRFSHDSVFLARQVFELMTPEEIQNIKGLDLCSGCGIIGLDFIFHCQKEWGKTPRSFDFLEVQDVYRSHFVENVTRLGQVASSLQFVNQNYTALQNSENAGKYDLILCNPPYFFADKGTLSPSEFKNRCRFFIDSGFAELLLGISASLAENGKAYLLLRDLSEHGWHSLEEAKSILKGTLHIELLGDIRGTHFVCLSSAKKF